MEKFIGAVIILAAALGFGRCCIQGQRRHLKQLLQWKEYIWMIQNGMEGWNTPVIPLLEELGNQADEPFAVFFRELAITLENYSESDIVLQWRRIAKEKRKDFIENGQRSNNGKNSGPCEEQRICFSGLRNIRRIGQHMGLWPSWR